MKNWKTTVAGIGAILAGLGGAAFVQFDNDPSTTANWVVLGPIMLAGIGLLFGKDFNKTGA